MSAASFRVSLHGPGSANSRIGSQHTAGAPSSAAERELFLQEEIRILRRQMEETFSREQSFTSETVIEISILLDIKINEYMQLVR
ncbi:aspartyl-phosphate phosphatase Spo0E family protein [Saccharibacillus sp. CPCC 101409]|uniref:aspartyl-phosphate phosphatase Spo0E family protein n=1 Tax=Saccharibacillus sp. CPCC 101409 TaxID=3058041 RepID=UPI002671D768|nr:aspartyl-phosphate phosphatase Spo0E family protein [Saccharibacillus sp. CPCC 101409]MDO3408768.1 aspartyl-phosphate phosphatase Spo0E family protein [Saccharibacillus sp. CPCC 101409]